jgi:hypothetical protein
MGDLYAAQTVCVGFHSSPGEGACTVMKGCYENKPRRHAKGREEKKSV